MGQGPSDGMSDAQSPFDSIPPDSRFGWKVMTVFPNSPSSGLGIVPYFSILTHVNGQRCGRSEHDLLPLIRENVPTEFTFLNLSNLQSKSVTITPRRNWGGEGLLGLMIRFEHSFENSHLEAVHVLEVHHGSPAEKAGLRAHVDFMLGDSKIAFKNYDALDLFLTQHDGHEGRLLVFNRDTFSVRDVFIRPSQTWGGAGSLGCDVGLGMLHQLPIDGKREVVYYEQQTGTENNAIASTSSTGAAQPMMPHSVAPSADQFQQHHQQQQQFPQQQPQQQSQPQQQVQQQQQPQQFQQPLPPQQFQPNQFQPQFQQQQQQQQQSMTQTFQQVSPQQQQQSLSPPQQQFQQPQQQVEAYQQAAPAPAPVPAPVPSPVMSPPQFVAPPAEAVASSFPQPVSNMNIPPMASPPQSFAPSSNPPSMVNPSVIDSTPSGVPSSAPSQAPVSVGGLSTANFAPSSTDARLSSDPAALQALLAYQQQQFEQQRLQFQAQQAAWEAQQRQQQQHIANPNNNLPFPSTITQQPAAGLP